MSSDCSATIRQESKRAASWREVFGSNTVPIRSPFPERASAPGITAGLFYQIDLSAITPEQRARLVRYIAHAFALPEAEVDASLDKVGCSILADDVTVTVRNPQKWL